MNWKQYTHLRPWNCGSPPEAPGERFGCIAEEDVMNQLPKSLSRGFRRRATVPWSQMRVLHPIHRIRFRSIQALDVPFLILTGDWGVYSTYALIRNNEYYIRRNWIQIYYGTTFAGMQRYTYNPSRNRCGVYTLEYQNCEIVHRLHIFCQATQLHKITSRPTALGTTKSKDSFLLRLQQSI